MRRLRLAFCLLPLTSLNCGDGGGDENVVRRPGKPDTVYVKSSDSKMDDAIRQARATVGEFITALQAPKSGERGFAIKKPFLVQGTTHEHIWLSNVTYDGKVFHGRVDNEPVDAKNVKLGDKATVGPEELSDWMFARDGKLVGGQTIRALYDLKSPAGRKKFEKETGLKAD